MKKLISLWVALILVSIGMVFILGVQIGKIVNSQKVSINRKPTKTLVQRYPGIDKVDWEYGNSDYSSTITFKDGRIHTFDDTDIEDAVTDHDFPFKYEGEKLVVTDKEGVAFFNTHADTIKITIDSVTYSTIAYTVTSYKNSKKLGSYQTIAEGELYSGNLSWSYDPSNLKNNTEKPVSNIEMDQWYYIANSDYFFKLMRLENDYSGKPQYAGIFYRKRVEGSQLVSEAILLHNTKGALNEDSNLDFSEAYSSILTNYRNVSGKETFDFQEYLDILYPHFEKKGESWIVSDKAFPMTDDSGKTWDHKVFKLDEQKNNDLINEAQKMQIKVEELSNFESHTNLY
ncbi:hypothetical protein ACFSN5_10165 [Streptococcus tangpeifui]|uniref:hypothetical protein n=1 Tax=Streptococcus tangpeifui TaxID=2709400 RepID=UPI0013ECC615|nr:MULTISPECIES: hypothetical protein [unclassified Streptococcus]